MRVRVKIVVSSQKNCCAFAGPTFALAVALASGMENWVGYDRSFTYASVGSDPRPDSTEVNTSRG